MVRVALKITKRVVDGLQPGGLAWDTELRGFGVRCQRRGKVYVLKYRCHGRQRWYSIGQHGAPWTPEAARREAQRLLGIVAAGDDPAEVRDAAKADLTVSELCDLYVAEGCTLKKPSTIANDRGRIERHIKPLLGKRFCRHISPRTLERYRVAGNGPRFCKAGRRVIYRRDILDDWVTEHTFSSTAAAQASNPSRSP